MFRAVAPLIRSSCEIPTYPVLVSVSRNYPGHMGRLPTCYSPVRHWLPKKASFSLPSVRLACIRHAASVHPEPGSNSPFDLALRCLWHLSLYNCLFFEIDVLVCILFPVQFSKIMCTSAVLIYITKYFSLRQMFFWFFFMFFTVYAYISVFKRKLVFSQFI